VSDSVHYERAREHLEALGLNAALSELDGVLDSAAREERAPVTSTLYFSSRPSV